MAVVAHNDKGVGELDGHLAPIAVERVLDHLVNDLLEPLAPFGGGVRHGRAVPNPLRDLLSLDVANVDRRPKQKMLARGEMQVAGGLHV